MPERGAGPPGRREEGVHTVLTGKPEARRRQRAWRAALALLVLATGLLLVFRLAIFDGDGGPAAHHHRPSASATTTTTATATSTASAPSCPGPEFEGQDRDARGVAEGWRKVVEPVYRAACGRDYDTLARLLAAGSPQDFSTDPCEACTSQEVIAMWREEYAFDGADLARLLTTRPTVDQGGLVYANGEALAVFARGAADIPPQWSAYYPDCTSDRSCRDMLDLLRPTSG